MFKSFYLGILDFIAALKSILTSAELRRWYLRHLISAFVISLFLLITVFGGFAFGLKLFHEQIVLWTPWVWFDWGSLVLLAIIWAIILIFTAGPISMLIMNVYFMQVTDWNKMKSLLNLPLLRVQDALQLGFLLRSIIRAVFLSLVVLISALASFIPYLIFIPILVASYSLSQDWIWTISDAVPNYRLSKRGLTYKLGLGLIPALSASVPFVGVACLPVLEVACLRAVDMNSLRNDGQSSAASSN